MEVRHSQLLHEWMMVGGNVELTMVGGNVKLTIRTLLKFELNK